MSQAPSATSRIGRAIQGLRTKSATGMLMRALAAHPPNASTPSQDSDASQVIRKTLKLKKASLGSTLARALVGRLKKVGQIVNTKCQVTKKKKGSREPSVARSEESGRSSTRSEVGELKDQHRVPVTVGALARWSNVTAYPDDVDGGFAARRPRCIVCGTSMSHLHAEGEDPLEQHFAMLPRHG